MKKTLITSIVVGTIFVGTTTYFCVRNFRPEVQLQNCEKVESERLHQVLRNKELILLTALETDGKIFSPTMTDSINKNGLDLALNETPKLIYYYSELNCTSCVEIIIKEIESFRKKNGFSNVVYISDYKRVRDMMIFKRINQIKSDIYNVESLNMPIGKVHLPTIFVVDQDKKIRSTYIPLKEDVNAFRIYLKTIATKFFNKEIGYMEPTHDIEKQTDKTNTSISLSTGSINLGTFSSQITKQAIFQIKNIGKQPLVIKAVNTTCGCTVAKYDKKPVDPSETTTIVLEYKPNSSGYFSKTADVVCNVPEGFVRLTISGEVEEK